MCPGVVVTTQEIEPVRLVRVTTDVDPVQDRLRLTSAVEDGEPMVLWMTQRLLKRLVPHLLEWLQGAARLETSQPVPDYHSEAVHSFAQQAAVAQLSSHAPVRAREQQPSWLVEELDIARTPDFVSLTFRNPQHSAVLVMQAQPLRQWLTILHEQSNQAGWLLSGWPQWITESATGATRPAQGTMH